jgi:two-component system alkaline phosphatase synthesis response regulator PhoP
MGKTRLRLLIIARESTTQAGLYMGLVRSGFACSVVPGDNGVMEQLSQQPPDLVLVEIGDHSPDSRTWELIRGIKQQGHLPTIALVSEETLDSIDGHHDLDDFLTGPYGIKELVLRIKRLLHKRKNTGSGELIKCNGLVIDLAKCEVTVGDKVIELTFREYELLKFLASNKGRVYTREALLNRVWGYDYYGGDRTVDVHIRRLRSKIGNSEHTPIETVRNIGYKFRENSA